MRALPSLLVSVLLFALSPSLSAQAGTWRFEAGRGRATERESVARGYAALPASALVSVGAQVAYERDEVVARLGDREVRFRIGSAEVRIAGESHTLSNPVYSDGGVVFVPADFFRRFLADASGGTLVVEPLERVVRREAPAAPPTDDPIRRAVTASLESRPAAPAPSRNTRETETARQPESARGSARESDAAAPPIAPAPAPPVVPASAPARPGLRRLVVVDAGHGGVDPGARGPGGTREKDVTLRVARRVAALLRDDPTLEVRMTRDRDTLIALHDRARFANRWKDEGQPALFISIHCNANESRSEKGYETYFLAEARTADARRVEQFENSAQQYEDTPPAGPMAFILTDLRQNQYLRESGDWAQIVQNRLKEIHPGPNRGVKQAGFAVLRGTFMPAVLVEIGFVSNPREEGLLTDGEMQESIARQLARSVRDFFDRPPPSPSSD